MSDSRHRRGSNDNRRPGASHHEVHNRRPGRLSGATAQRVLDGGDGPAPLPQLVAAATAPATAAELRGESAARAVFRSVHSAPLPDTPRRSPVRITTSMMIAKAIAAIALTTGTAGGIALATSTRPAEPETRATIESAAAETTSAVRTSVTPTPTASAHHDDGADASAVGRPHSAGGAVRKSPEARAPRSTGQCRASSNIATDDHPGMAAENPASTELTCIDVDERGDTATGGSRAGRPSVAPGNPEHRTGQPDGAVRATDDAEGDDTAKKAWKAEERGEGDDHGAAARTDGGSRGRSDEDRQDG